MMTDAQALLRAYAVDGSEEAFRELVVRYLGLVYSSALRVIGGDTHLAEDVAQTVFTDLARHAGSISPKVMLGGWLHQRTFNVATTFMRGERRRRARELEAMEMNALEDHSAANFARIGPILDEAITKLKPEDRAAILFRFFERRDLRSIGQLLGTNEDAGQKRVTRALEKLRLLLERRGVALSATALAAGLAAEEITAAPATLVGTIAGTALASGAVASGTSTLTQTVLLMSKIKLGITALVATGAAATLLIQHQTQNKLRADNEALRQQVAQLAAIRDAVERLPEIKRAPNDSEALRQQQQDLLRLRGLVAAQRSQERELRQKLEAAESQADLAKFEVDMLRRGPLKQTSSYVIPASEITALSEKFQVAQLQLAGRDTAVNAVQSVLHAVFHNGVDEYYDLHDSPNSTEFRKSDLQDRITTEHLASLRQFWGGDSVQGINNLKMAPVPNDRNEDLYDVFFRFDYGSNPRPTGAPTGGDITLLKTPEGWKFRGSGSNFDPTLP